jgi:hypothetical protein
LVEVSEQERTRPYQSERELLSRKCGDEASTAGDDERIERTQTVRNCVTVDWPSVPALILEPGRIPPEVQVKALSVNNQGRMTLSGPGRIDQVKLDEFRARYRLQELVFDMARAHPGNVPRR